MTKEQNSAQGALKSAQEVKDAEGRQYHLATAPGEVSDYILFCGDPDRADRTAKKFDKIEIENRYREYVTITGIYKGQRMSVCATGIGCDNTEIAVVELSQCIGDNPTFLRIGTSGALQSHINIGEMVISTGAVRYEDTSLNYVPPGYPAVSHYEVVQALREVAEENKTPHHIGLTATCSGFYGAQGRSAGKFKTRFPNRTDELRELNVYNMEMEASTLLTLASIQGFRAGAICAIFANRYQDQFIDMNQKYQVEDVLIETGLQAMLRIIKQDQKKVS